ncbi:MAG TPA: helix-turn-helix transcriptional regulator [Tepidisphaeraceae bacterium]|nr:helix-turn-helix transcriptional regulator [Tepidisphaeraceae bacterium]
MDISTPEHLGIAIRARRKQLKLTQSHLAMTCGTGLRFIVDLEKGKPTCHVGKTLTVLQSLGLAVQASPLGHAAVGGNPK